MDRDYAGICGITEKELTDGFALEIDRMSDELDISRKECIDELKKMYDGYHFHPDTEGLYNPFSLLNALKKREFGTYWFSTGTPSFLVEKLKKINFDPEKFTNGTLYADGNVLSDYRADNPDPVPLLYQTGYLTIKDYDRKYRSYMLSYPNDEVKYSFIESLVPYYLYEDNPGAPP